jgi:hypothetical protein
MRRLHMAMKLRKLSKLSINMEQLTLLLEMVNGLADVSVISACLGVH